MTMRRWLSLVASAALATAGSPAAATSIVDVTVTGTRIHLGDVVVGLGPDVANVDMGPAPAATGVRMMSREELAEALHAHGVEHPAMLPRAVRVHRKLKRLSPDDLGRIVTDGLSGRLTRGVSLQTVNPTGAVTVPEGWTEVRCEVPRPPRRLGTLASAASVTFFDGSQALWTVSVPVALVLSQEATLFDVPRGTRVTLFVRRGLVEVSSSATVSSDADVGSVVPVVVAPSGRTLSARLETDHAAVVIDSP